MFTRGGWSYPCNGILAECIAGMGCCGRSIGGGTEYGEKLSPPFIIFTKGGGAAAGGAPGSSTVGVPERSSVSTGAGLEVSRGDGKLFSAIGLELRLGLTSGDFSGVGDTPGGSSDNA